MGEDEPGMMEDTAEVPDPSAAAHLPEAASVCDAATALDTAMDMLDPQPTLVELLICHVLLPRELLSQIEINSCALPIWSGQTSDKPLKVSAKTDPTQIQGGVVHGGAFCSVATP
jgi:hypothetical protein